MQVFFEIFFAIVIGSALLSIECTNKEQNTSFYTESDARVLM